MNHHYTFIYQVNEDDEPNELVIEARNAIEATEQFSAEIDTPIESLHDFTMRKHHKSS